MHKADDDERSGPIRTCVGCGQQDERDALIRLVLSPEGELVLDLKGRLPGRGAWLHPTRRCAAAAEQDPRRLSRSFKARVTARGLEQQLVDTVLRSILDGLSLAAAAGALIGGHDVVEIGLRDGTVGEIIFASDASDRTVADISGILGDRPATRVPFDKEMLGARVGRAPRAVLGLLAAPAFEHLRGQLRRLRSLG